MSHRTHHGSLVSQHTELVFFEPAFWLAYLLFAVLILIGLAGCASQPPPYGIATVRVHNVVDGEHKDCAAEAVGGLEFTSPQLRAADPCGGKVDTSAGSVAAFEGQRIGAPLFAAKIQADAARDQALIAYGQQLGAMGVCGGIVAASGGALAPAVLAPCLAALRGMAPAEPAKSPAPTPAPVPAPLPPSPRASAASPLREFLDRRTLRALESPEP